MLGLTRSGTPSWGRLPTGHPYHRFGTGSQRLVIFPGVMDSLGWNTPGRLTAGLLALYNFRPFRGYDVWVLSRPPGLSADASAASLAAGYADALDHIGPGHVLGFSLGGILGAHLAADAPSLVDRLVLASLGDRLGPYGRSVVERWRRHAANERWDEIHLEYSRIVHAGWRRTVVPPLYRLTRPLLPTPAVSGDIVTSCRVALDYEGKQVLPDVEVPTLVVGGADDTLYPTAARRAAARLVQDGRIATLSGGHAVYEESRDEFCATVEKFLDA